MAACAWGVSLLISISECGILGDQTMIWLPVLEMFRCSFLSVSAVFWVIRLWYGCLCLRSFAAHFYQWVRYFGWSDYDMAACAWDVSLLISISECGILGDQTMIWLPVLEMFRCSFLSVSAVFWVIRLWYGCLCSRCFAAHFYQWVQYFGWSDYDMATCAWGVLPCAWTLMHATANRGCTDTVREFAAKVWFKEKNPLLHQGLEPACFFIWTIYPLNDPRPCCCRCLHAWRVTAAACKACT